MLLLQSLMTPHYACHTNYLAHLLHLALDTSVHTLPHVSPCPNTPSPTSVTHPMRLLHPDICPPHLLSAFTCPCALVPATSMPALNTPVSVKGTPFRYIYFPTYCSYLLLHSYLTYLFATVWLQPYTYQLAVVTLLNPTSKNLPSLQL